MDDLDGLSLPDLHEKVRRLIAAGRPGFAQLRDEPVSTVSLVKNGPSTKLYGLLPSIGRDELRTVADVRNAIMEAMADGDPDALASLTGVFAPDDFERRARHFETRFVFPTKKDKATALRLRTFAHEWFGGASAAEAARKAAEAVAAHFPAQRLAA